MAHNMVLRGRRYSVRLFIPADLHGEFGRKEIVRSLKTGNKQHAKILLRGVQRIAEHLFFFARLGMVPRKNLPSLLSVCIDDALCRCNDAGRNSLEEELERIIRRLATNSKLSLNQAVGEWMEQKRVIGLTAGTLKMYSINSRLAIEFYGANYPVEKLNNLEMLRFVQDQQAQGIKNTTITRRVRLLKEVVALACANHGLTPPSYKIELKDDTADVLPYSAAELNQIFTILNTFRPCEFWKYWGVLIGLLGGLRREEVVSLRATDIKQAGDIWFFDVVDSKTDAGIRQTPISDILIRLGFLEFVKERVESGEPYLLMCHLPAPSREYTAIPAEKFSDFFRNSIRKKLSLELRSGQKKDLHSLRHNYSDSLKQGGVRPDITDELCGHEHAPGSMRSIYDEKFGLEVLHEHVNKASWRCDFSMLRTWGGG